MLALRFVIFAGVTAIALLGLFKLLDNLGEPELLRSPKAAAVKGCDTIDTETTARLCPQLFCQKFLLDTKAVVRRTRFENTVNRRAGAEQLVAGIARTDPASPGQDYACLIHDNKITAGRLLAAGELARLSAADGQWKLEEPQPVSPEP
jgi:hypothetical protein